MVLINILIFNNISFGLDGKFEFFPLSKWLVLVVAFHSRKVR